MCAKIEKRKICLIRGRLSCMSEYAGKGERKYMHHDVCTNTRDMTYVRTIHTNTPLS